MAAGFENEEEGGKIIKISFSLSFGCVQIKRCSSRRRRRLPVAQEVVVVGWLDGWLVGRSVDGSVARRRVDYILYLQPIGAGRIHVWVDVFITILP